MTQPQTQVEITIAQFTSAFDIPRSNFQRWRDAVYSGVGDSPYTKDELRIILEEGIRQSQNAIGATRNRNVQKLSKILNQL
jgi:hypothetical protein